MRLLSEKELLPISTSDKSNFQFVLQLSLYGLGKKNFDYSRYNQQALEVMPLKRGDVCAHLFAIITKLKKNQKS